MSVGTFCGGRESRSHLTDNAICDRAIAGQHLAMAFYRVCRQSGHFTRLIRDSSFRDYFDLFKFRSFEAKKFRHLDDLIRTYEIRGLSAESVYTGSKLAALHCLRDVQTKTAYTFRRVKQTEFANNHFSLSLLLAVVCS